VTDRIKAGLIAAWATLTFVSGIAAQFIAVLPDWLRWTVEGFVLSFGLLVLALVAYAAYDMALAALRLREEHNRAAAAQPTPTWLQNTPTGAAERDRLEWAFIARTLADCRKRIEADGSRQSWLDPAENIARERSKKEST